MKKVMTVHIVWGDNNLPVYAYEEGMPVYIRYGMWDNRNLSRNHGTKQKEDGVSAYRAVVIDGVARLDEEMCRVARDQLHGQGRLVFPVTGREVGIGSDGEPVLRRVYAVALPLHEECRV